MKQWLLCQVLLFASPCVRRGQRQRHLPSKSGRGFQITSEAFECWVSVFLCFMFVYSEKWRRFSVRHI
uniref:Uncharacterized protein n=1 Tax=Cynoglossus semilaevis TaxID=244447 RepID=A0A3P8UMK9_CYNSE